MQNIDEPKLSCTPFLRRSGEICSDNEPVCDEPGALIDQDQIARNQQAEIAYLLSELDDDRVALVEAPVTPDQSTLSLDADDVAAIKALDSTESRPCPNYREMFEKAKADKKRRRDRQRQQRHRAKPVSLSYQKLATALKKATAKPRGDKQLEQLRGREGEIAIFHFLSLNLTKRFGPMSDAKLAQLMCAQGEQITRKQVWNLRRIVTALKAENGPWHDL